MLNFLIKKHQARYWKCFVSVVESDLQWTNPWMAPQQPPASLRVWVSKEWWSSHHPGPEAGNSQSQASTLSTDSGTMCKRTYLYQQNAAAAFSVSGGKKPTWRRETYTGISDRVTLSSGLNSSSMSTTLHTYAIEPVFCSVSIMPASAAACHRDKCISNV